MEASITSRGMLICLTVSKWSARKLDRSASAEVTAAHGAESDAGWFNKKLIPKEGIKDVESAATALRSHHYEQTLPWTDIGYRILPAANFLHYTETHNRLKAEFEACVREFVARYADFVAEGRNRLGSLFSEMDYPAAGIIARKFDVALSVLPLPKADDFRVDLGDDIRDRLAAEIEDRTRLAIEAANADIWQRLYTAVTHLRDRLAKYSVDEAGKVSHPFRDSAINNLRELVTLLPRLNMTQDQELDAMGARLAASLCAQEPETLRVNEGRREAVTKEADAILAAMAGYVTQD